MLRHATAVRALTCALLCLAATAATAAKRTAEDFFTLPANLLLEHAASFGSADTSSAVCLYDSWVTRIDADNRQSMEYIHAYRIRTSAVIDELARIDEPWEPWHENRPEIRARVVTKDGGDFQLDPANIVENRGNTDSPIEYSDARSLSAPLPNVGVGAIVIVGVRRSEHHPFFAQGRAMRYPFGAGVPVLESHVEVTAPASMPTKIKISGLPDLKPQRRESDGMATWQLSVPMLPPTPAEETWSVPDSSARPRIDISTGRSWRDIAIAYRALLPPGPVSAADAAAAREALKGARTRQDSITALVTLLHRRVRYTAIRLGTSGMVPANCTATLSRGYGDCKDKGTALIGLLATAGFKADLALLRTGFVPDVDPDLPGMGMFDHAIVRVEGNPPVWIDATAEHYRPGILPLGVEGRRVLLLTPGREGLSRLPETTADENTYQETRVFRVAERGPGEVHERTERLGWMEADLRNRFATADPADVTRDIERYASNRYRAMKADSVYFTAPGNYREPMTLQFATHKCESVNTELESVVVPAAWGDLLQVVFNILPTGQTEESVRAGRRIRRQRAFRMPIPFHIRMHFEVDVPDGFTPRPAPEDQLVFAGPVSIRTHQTVRPNHATLLVELDGERRVWSAREHDRYVAVAESLLHEAGPAVVLDIVGATLARDEHFAAALAEYRRLAAAHPKEALHQEQIADLLRDVGLGEAAREAARKGVELEPSAGPSHREVGYILMHDLIGAPFGITSDREGAKRAFNRALAHDSSDVQSRRWLAMLHMRNDEGVERGKGAELDSAVAHLMLLRTRYGDRSNDGTLLLALADRGRFGEILELDPPAECEDPSPQMMNLVARAGRDGVASAIRYAERTVRDAKERRVLLGSAAWMLISLRRYEDAQAILAELTRSGRPAPELQPIITLMNTFSENRSKDVSSETADGTFRLLLAKAFAGDTLGLREMLAPELAATPDGGSILDGIESLPRALGKAWPNLGPELLAAFRTETTGDPRTGVRVRLLGFGDQPMGSVDSYLVPGPKGFLLLGGTDNLEYMGVRAQKLAEQGAVADARQWLEWAQESSPAADGATTPTELGWRWWLRSTAGDDRHRMRSAAAAIASKAANPVKALAALREERQSAGTDDERTAFDIAIASCLGRLERWAELEALTTSMSERLPDSSPLHGTLLVSLRRQGKWNEARALIEKRRKQHPDERDLWREAADVEAASGNRAPGWDRWHRMLIADGKPRALDFNQYAWELLMRDAPVESTLVMARRACDPEDDADASSLHTLACANAAAGRLSEARRVLMLEMNARSVVRPEELEWLVVGQIAEKVGETDLARRAYTRARAKATKRDDWNSVPAFAERRLAALGAH